MYIQRRRASLLLSTITVGFCTVGCAQDQATSWSAGQPAPTVEMKYLVGGPLEGIELPPSKRGPYPQKELYPGSVEQWRAYWMKYTPSRSLFDAQSLVRSWKASEIAGVPQSRIVEYKPTGSFNGQPIPPVPAVRAGIKAPVFRLDLGTLPIGMYVVRTIAAALKEEIRPFRKPLYLTVRVNDKTGGEWSTYRQRISYTDDFYSVSEAFFHADEARAYRAEVFVDEGSEVELFINSFTLDDALAGSQFKNIKTRQTLTTPAAIAELKKQGAAFKDNIKSGYDSFSPAERLARDELIWKYLPPTNAQASMKGIWDPPGVEYGTTDKTQEQIEVEWGQWSGTGLVDFYGIVAAKPKLPGVFLVNEKLGLQYTTEDYWVGKPLPDPYPFKDSGAGFYFPNPAVPEKGKILAPIAGISGYILKNAHNIATTNTKIWFLTGKDDFARDAAINLIRYAYEFPGYDAAHNIEINAAQPGFAHRDVRFRERHEYFVHGDHYPEYTNVLKTYDALYPYIKGNEELAKSVGRFVPWVKSSDDIIKLLDTYLVQHEAKRILRYHWYTDMTALATVAAVLGENNTTDPWMDWLFVKAFQYPLPTAGLQDLMITANEREGPQYIGSTFYGGEEGALSSVSGLEPYLRAGGNPKYDLGDPTRYPKPLAHVYWQLNNIIGGQDFLRIGDVTGPEKLPGRTIEKLVAYSDKGWRWSKDPRFAWVLTNLAGRKDQTDEEWRAIETAATKVKRAPWLDLRSRDINNWAAILEAGQQYDDYRYRRSLYVRTGVGTGHAHADTLDLQGIAHGVPWTVDDGQRSGYSKPNSRFSRIHNTVEVDGKGNQEFGLSSYSWTQNVTDAPGAQYLRANAVPPPNAKYFNRQVALVDVDGPAEPVSLTVDQQKPGAVLPPKSSYANSYIFDVFRVSGGNVHGYNFHGNINDEFVWNAQNEKPIAHVPEKYDVSNEANYLSSFVRSEGKKFGGDAPSTLEATWRLTRDEKIGAFAGEQAYLQKNYDAATSRKYTRLHFLNADGMRAMRSKVVSEQFKYDYDTIMAVKRGENLESAFTAIIEPYAGEPFIASQRLLEVQANDADAKRAVAVEVKTRNGHTDINFADGRPEKARTVGDMSFSGEYAFVSSDANGLRQATLSGGTLLSTPDVKITAAQHERTAKVLNVDYLAKRLQLDTPFPAASAGRIFEIGTPQKWTSYTIDSVNGDTISTTRSADFYRSGISQVVPDKNRVDGKLTSPLGFGKLLPAKDWVVSNDDASKAWRTTAVDGNDFALNKPVQAEDFPGNVMRIWEYGVGDTVRQSTFVTLRRVADGIYELTGDVDATISLKGAQSIEFSTGRKAWRTLNGGGNISVGLSKLSALPVYLRITK